MDIKLYNIVAIVNEGFAELVIDTAKEIGARGGTVIPANSGVTSEAMKLYGIGVQPSKEIILIIVKAELVETILSKLYDKAGTSSDAMGIFFTLPVTHASENLFAQYSDKKKD